MDYRFGFESFRHDLHNEFTNCKVVIPRLQVLGLFTVTDLTLTGILRATQISTQIFDATHGSIGNFESETIMCMNATVGTLYGMNTTADTLIVNQSTT